jgi:hypothetical protein
MEHSQEKLGSVDRVERCLTIATYCLSDYVDQSVTKINLAVHVVSERGRPQGADHYVADVCREHRRCLNLSELADPYPLADSFYSGSDSLSDQPFIQPRDKARGHI